MNRTELVFDRPANLAATTPPEQRGIARDDIRLMVSSPSGHTHAQFHDLPKFLRSGDLLVVNRSATLPASLPANGPLGLMTLNLSTNYGGNLWLAEPRWSPSKQGPLPLKAGESLCVAGVTGRLVAQYPGLPRLWFVQFDTSIEVEMVRKGQPIRYGYLEGSYPLSTYQTVFADTPGSAEMPSAGYPFTQPLVNALRTRGVLMADITLHTGVSSLEVEVDEVEQHPLYPEPFVVSASTAQAVNAARAEGRRIIGVGTTVVRALESAWDSEANGLRAASGFTRLYITPTHGVHVVDGLITGLHDPVTSHLAMLYAIAGQTLVRDAYAEAVREGYLWHEFGDSHLILARE
ncbi:MAG: S-adenosylmethionine:tRNA ribosyltransferase-isomerase [Burkholderiales bacterium]|nr:S-adenosylmethionine:tRNA ribosyltransferase-isomerase [Anaerolineae bacterium]